MMCEQTWDTLRQLLVVLLSPLTPTLVLSIVCLRLWWFYQIDCVTASLFAVFYMYSLNSMSLLAKCTELTITVLLW